MFWLGAGNRQEVWWHAKLGGGFAAWHINHAHSIQGQPGHQTRPAGPKTLWPLRLNGFPVRCKLSGELVLSICSQAKSLRRTPKWPSSRNPQSPGGSRTPSFRQTRKGKKTLGWLCPHKGPMRGGTRRPTNEGSTHLTGGKAMHHMGPYAGVRIATIDLGGRC